MPSAVMIQDSSAIAGENGMIQMFRMLSKGDSVNVTMPVTKFFKDVVGAPVPNGVDTTLNISYCIQVSHIMKMDEFRTFQEDLMKKMSEGQVAKDATIISKYLEDNKINAQQDTSGLRYVIHTNKGGSKPTITNCVEVKYRGKFLKDGKVFDQWCNSRLAARNTHARRGRFSNILYSIGLGVWRTGLPWRNSSQCNFNFRCGIIGLRGRI